MIAKLLLISCLVFSAGEVWAGSDRDPYENLNRKVFWFNEGIDSLLLKPVAKQYVRWTPGVVQQGVSNFFSNLAEIGNVANNLLQGKPGQAGGDLARFLINSSVGVLGLLDTASRLGIARSDEDLGQTLGRWGVAPGPYVMLPLLGPRTLRDAIAWYPDSQLDPTNLLNEPVRYGLLAGEIVDLRARLLPTEQMIVGDRYTFIRDAYLQRRDFLVRDGELADDAFDEEFDDDFFE